MIRELKREKRIKNYDVVRIRIASPDSVREWSYGEVTKPDTLNYRTLKPEKDGLFCERIFGPEKDYECACGKYKKKRFRNTICDRCGVEVTTSRVRRSRMGHIELAVPVAHIWFVKSAPSKIGTLLDLSIRKLERILYYESYIVINPGDSDYEKKDLIDTDEYYEIRDKVGEDFIVMMGAEAVKHLLDEIDLESEAMNLRTQIKMETSKLKKDNAIKKLKIVDAFRKSGNCPEWMVLEVLPVLPPTLRPLVPLDGGRFATADFNDLYRRVITRNNRLKQLLDIRAPEVILRNEKRMLQEAVDALIDNARKTRPVKGRGNRPLKSLTDQLKGKSGRFRQNLLGKRVDYSGRSVITVGPELKIYQCGLPKEMAVELFKPFIIERLERSGEADKTKYAKKMVEKKQPEIWKILEEVIQDYPVLLNRAPTLHRLGIQAFMPVLTEDKAIKLHPMVCIPFNADFDGDQMAVYVPLSHEAQMEARVLMLSSRNLLLPSNGKLAMAAHQDIVLGSFYLTSERVKQPEEFKNLRYFASPEDVVAGYESEEKQHAVKGDKIINISENIAVNAVNEVAATDICNPQTKKVIVAGGMLIDAAATEKITEANITSIDVKFKTRSLDIHTWIRVKIKGIYHITTVGRVIFNQIIPDELAFQNKIFGKKDINELAMIVFNKVGQYETSLFLDELKELGFKYATKSGMTFSAMDVVVPKNKKDILDRATAEVKEITDIYMQGGITETERSNRVVDKWKIATEEVTTELMKELVIDQGGFNSINIMFVSGARGSKDQIKQLGGMRGLMDKPSKGGASTGAEVIETPIKSNFREGLTVLEYFISTHGARKGLADTAMKTADAGYLTRRLVDVAQNAIITEFDCGTIEGLEVSALMEGTEVVESLSERIQGATAAEDIFDPPTGKILVEANELISNELATKIEEHGIPVVKIRSVLTCEATKGICGMCYGRSLSTQKPATIGDPVGVIAAQSIGEPGTQLTLRTFHIGGTASTDVDAAEVKADDDGIIKFEKMNIVTNRAGEKISISHLGRIVIVSEETGEALHTYKVEYAATVYIDEGGKVLKEDLKNAGSGTRLFSWDRYNNPLVSTAEGTLVFENFIKDLTYKEEFNELTGEREISIIASREKKIQPQFRIKSKDGAEELMPLPTGISIDIEDGSYVHKGDILGKSSRITIKQRDITGGLPRVQDLFEARIPKEKAIISEITGKVTIGDLTKNGRIIFVDTEEGTLESVTQKKYVVPPGKRIIVHQGDIVDSGDPLSDGPLNPHDILKAKGIKAAQKLILEEIQEIYRKQGVKIDDKHISVIIRQMMKKVRILDPGHTNFLEGDFVDKNKVMAENKRIITEGGIGATYEQLLLGITKAALVTDSWLSAASFQETTKVLTQAAIAGKIDKLEGLKESIILGHRVPVGTGTKRYNQMVQNKLDEGKTIAEIVRELAHTAHTEDESDLFDF